MDTVGAAADGPRFDRAHCAAVLTRALQLPGGSQLVADLLAGLPGAVVTRRRSGGYGRSTKCVQLGHWRYWPVDRGRLEIAHIVDGVLLAEHEAGPIEAGPHITMVLTAQLREYGPRLLPDILALLEGLAVASD